MAENTQKNRVSFSVIIAGLVMILLFVGLAIFLVGQRGNIPTVDERSAEVRLKNLADLDAANQKILTQYRWVDKNKGVVGIPINRAMDLIVAQLQTIKLLISAFTAFFGVFILNRLPRMHHPLFDHEPFSRVTNDAFFLAIESVDPRFSETATREFLEEIGGKEVTLLFAND